MATSVYEKLIIWDLPRIQTPLQNNPQRQFSGCLLLIDLHGNSNGIEKWLPTAAQTSPCSIQNSAFNFTLYLVIFIAFPSTATGSKLLPLANASSDGPVGSQPHIAVMKAPWIDCNVAFLFFFFSSNQLCIQTNNTILNTSLCCLGIKDLQEH